MFPTWLAQLELAIAAARREFVEAQKLQNQPSWILTVEDFEIDRNPQTKKEKLQVVAPTAEDAVTIARFRHIVPFEFHDGPNMRTRKIVDIEPGIKKCGAGLTTNHPHRATFVCELSEGHSGMHRSGWHAWAGEIPAI